MFAALTKCIAALTLILLIIGPKHAHAAVLCPGPVCISEIRIDQPGADTDEYFEVSEVQGQEVDLSVYTYLVVGDGAAAAGSCVIEAVIALDGLVIAPNASLVVAESTFGLGTPSVVKNLNFENSDNVTHMLVRGFSGSLGQDLDSDDDGQFDELPWELLIDRIALVEAVALRLNTELSYGPPSIGPDNGQVPSHVLQCDSGWQLGDPDTTSGSDTPGGLPPECALNPASPTAIQLTHFQSASRRGWQLTQISVLAMLTIWLVWIWRAQWKIRRPARRARRWQ